VGGIRGRCSRARRGRPDAPPTPALARERRGRKKKTLPRSVARGEAEKTLLLSPREGGGGLNCQLGGREGRGECDNPARTGALRSSGRSRESDPSDPTPPHFRRISCNPRSSRNAAWCARSLIAS